MRSIFRDANPGTVVVLIVSDGGMYFGFVLRQIVSNGTLVSIMLCSSLLYLFSLLLIKLLLYCFGRVQIFGKEVNKSKFYSGRN